MEERMGEAFADIEQLTVIGKHLSLACLLKTCVVNV
jgi:hypothetical protein